MRRGSGAGWRGGFAGEKGPAGLTGRLSGQLAGNANWWSCLATKYERSQASRFGEYGGGDGVILFVGVSVGEYGFAGSGLAGDSGTAGLLTGNAIAGLGLATLAPKLGGGCLGGGIILRCTFSCNSLTMMGLGRKNSPSDGSCGFASSSNKCRGLKQTRSYRWLTGFH